MFYIITALLISLTLNAFLAYKLSNIKDRMIDEKVKNRAMKEYLGSKN